MNNDPGASSANEKSLSHRMRLPGFIVEQEIGFGDVIKRVSYAMGISPCAGCERRAATLNRWLVLSPRTRNKR